MMRGTGLLLAGVMLAVSPAVARAQRLLDWPIRTGAGAEALAAGAAGVFWNPASAGWAEGRGEALVLQIRGPAATDLSGAAVAGVYRLDGRSSILAGFHHLAVGGMGHTTTSPESHGNELRVAEDVVRLGAAWSAGAAHLGVVVEHWRSAQGGNGTRLGAGWAYRPGGDWRPTVAAAVYTGHGLPRWMAGATAERAIGRAVPVTVLGSYGLTGDPRVHAPGHRVSMGANWKERVLVSGGLSIEPNGEFTHVDPIAEARLRLGAYTVGVVREELPSSFGAATYFSLGISF